MSHELAEGHVAMLGVDDESDATALISTIIEVMSTVRFHWSPTALRTGLRKTALKAQHSDGKLADSDVKTSAFFDPGPEDGTPCLWLESGLLGGSGETQFLDKLGIDVLPRLWKAHGVAVILDSSKQVDLLKCWKDGPTAIMSACERRNISYKSSALRETLWLPGRVILPRYHEYIVQSMNFVFQTGETVALRCEEVRAEGEKVAYYICAKVLPKTVGRDSDKDHNEGTRDNGLSRKYNLDISAERSTSSRSIFQLLEIYKIQMRAEVKASVSLEATEGSSGDSERVLESADTITEHLVNDRKTLVRQLREMESLNQHDYKSALRRLYLQWHPDKCQLPYASMFFIITCRHNECYHGNKRFDFLRAFAEGGDDVSVANANAKTDGGPAAPYNPGPGVHSWFREFEEEGQRDAAAAAVAREQSRGRAGPVGRGFTSSGDPSVAPCFTGLPRRLDPVEADLFWRQSQQEQKVALCLNKEDFYSSCVWHCQQSVEMTIKSLMLRTCGITDEEMRGKGAHNLVKLMDSIVDDGASWPVSQAQLQELSQAYLSARYLAGDRQLPAERYDEDDASKAIEAMREILRWANSSGTLPMPAGTRGIKEEQYEAPMDDAVSFEPAPVPPLPPPPPPPPNDLPPPPPPVDSSKTSNWVPAVTGQVLYARVSVAGEGRMLDDGNVEEEEEEGVP